MIHDFIEDDSLSYVADAYAELMPPKPTGLLTGTACRLLRTGTAAVYELRAFYYDEYNRVIQERSTNMVGGYDNQYKSYDFMGNLLSNRHVHSTAQTTMSEMTVYTYDNQNRLLTCTHSLNGQPAVTVINNEYDALGRLSANRRNGHALLETHYSYNVRSWLTNISSPLFTETMYYNTEAPFTSTPAYGGNISALSWLSEDSIQRGYSLSYDSASRLTSADYRENETSSTKYQASYTYDANGNVTSLQRYGRYVSDWRLVDDLSYTYQGNRLQRVSKTGVSPKYYGAMYFHDGATANTEYEYDENGNMTKDLNRKISSIQYNLLNLPTKVTMTDDRTISYTYTAEGEKRRVISFVPYGTSVPIPFPDTLIYIPVDPVPFPGLGVTGAEVQGGVLPFNPIPTGISDTLTYCGNFIYRKGTLKRVLFDGGYVTPGTAVSAPEYHFFIRDHLGNNRLVLSSTGQVEQANHYYPYGATTYESADSVAQPYKYNGKELERTADIDWYDYGARFYDPVLARFTTMDPLCEKYYNVSPYAYCANNPVNAVDPDGRSTWVTHQGNGQYRIFGGSISDNDRNIYLYGHNEDGRFTRLKSIGESALTTSFFDSESKTWAVGSTISLTDESGKAFLSQAASLEITLDDYLNKARTNHPYDFKVTNGTGKVVDSSRKYVFRGMPIGKTGNGMTLFASGKDVGNMAAGIVAAKNGITWPMARMTFDIYISQ